MMNDGNDWIVDIDLEKFFDTVNHDKLMTIIGRTIKDGKWFLEKAENWKDKRLAMFCVGAGPYDNPDVAAYLENALTPEQQKYIKLFYCQGGVNYDNMKTPYKIAMKMLVSALKKKKDATEKEKAMADMLASSYDISDIKFIEPIVSYLEEKE